MALGVRSTAALTLAVASLAAGCGGSSPSDHAAPIASTKASVAAPSRPSPISALQLASAMRINPPDGATSAYCRPSSEAERAGTPFGHTRAPLFVCSISLRGEVAEDYDVQILGRHDPCYVAERRRRGQADYGCVTLR